MSKKIISILFITALLTQTALAAYDELPPVTGSTETSTQPAENGDTSSTTSDTTTTSTSTETSTQPAESGDTSSTTSGTTATSTLKTETKTEKAFEDFSDVSVDHPYYNAIILLRYQGLLKGYPDNTFRPDQPLNRVEALKLIFELASIDLNTGVAPASFTDIEKSTWYTSYLNRAVFLEIVGGYPDGSFKPAQSVNLVEFLKMLEIAQKADLSKTNLSQIPYGDVRPGEWYSKYVNFAKINGLVDADTSNNIRPAEPLTRGRAAEIIRRYGNFLKQVKPTTPATDDTSSPAPEIAKDFGIYVSTSYKFAIQYPRNWFYSNIDSTDKTAIRTYGFGPKDLSENVAQVVLELLPDDKDFAANQEYSGFMFKKVTLEDGRLQFSAKINNSSRVYRLTGAAVDEATLQVMIASLTTNIEGLETTTYGTADTTTSSTTETTP